MTNILVNVAVQERKLISNLNRKQLKEGIKSDSTVMPTYVEGSKQPSAPGRITLFEFGDYVAGIEPLIDDRGLELIGLDEKTGILASKYGSMILGLTEENLDILREAMKPRIIQKIKTIL